MLFKEIIAVYCENHTEHINTLCGQNASYLTLKQVVHVVTAGLLNIYFDTDQRQIRAAYSAAILSCIREGPVISAATTA
jgi:hypothetical protein